MSVHVYSASTGGILLLQNHIVIVRELYGNRLYELLKKQQRIAMISDYIQNDIFLNLYMSMFAVSCMAIA